MAKTFLAFLRKHSNASVANVYPTRSIQINLAFTDVLGDLQNIIELEIP